MAELIRQHVMRYGAKDNLLMRSLILGTILVCMVLGCSASPPDFGEEEHSDAKHTTLPQNTSQTASLFMELLDHECSQRISLH